ncbi:MAG: hypothetical protein Q8K93_15365 [Reyranella sp.]|uniref:hypothetical protein n=1 Tax=Reyranella sp. TaxID=1929291 RepID=UPI00272EED7D|nr:hypothetical protein [Reyranella sp.]MDP1963571.1 hypothetical protein [Reyranella sp.]MDP2378457.1 hypothetical protein [Reyranella sp.]
MAPTNRLIEARRAELRAEANADKRREAKAAPEANRRRQRTERPKTQPKAKA